MLVDIIYFFQEKAGASNLAGGEKISVLPGNPLKMDGLNIISSIKSMYDSEKRKKKKKDTAL